MTEQELLVDCLQRLNRAEITYLPAALGWGSGGFSKIKPAPKRRNQAQTHLNLCAHVVPL
jgi:hypothetical protein